MCIMLYMCIYVVLCMCACICVCMLGSTLAGLAFCATLSLTKLIIIIITIWDPYTKKDVLKLEILQHRAARFVTNKPWYKNKHNESITKMLTDLHWPTLESRRKQARLIVLFKIVNGLLTVPARFLPPLPTITYTRANHSLKYVHPQPNLDLYKYSFLPRTVPQWNALQFASIENLSFKEQLQAAC